MGRVPRAHMDARNIFHILRRRPLKSDIDEQHSALRVDSMIH